MGEVTPLRPGGNPRRALFSDERGTGLRATWHPERELVVLSLWRDDVCAGTFRMTLDEAARLVDFLASHLTADPADPGPAPAGPAPPTGPAHQAAQMTFTGAPALGASATPKPSGEALEEAVSSQAQSR